MKNLENITIKATVVHGAKRGRELGFPTANLALNEQQTKMMPDIGIYAVWVESPCSQLPKTFMGAASWGFNPTFGLKNPQLEVHILDFDDDIYGETLNVHFSEYIRGEINLSCLDDLTKTIQEDCNKTRDILKGKEAVA
jgi:riboflavin kinase/FMN adenylyltransferase